MSHILVVEDEAIIRNAVRRLLTRHNHEVTEADSVDAAKALDLTSYDMIISDLRLPGGHGTDLIELAGKVPVLIMTSYASLRSAVDAMKLGAVDYIAKPFDHDEMIQAVERILAMRTETTDAVADPHDDLPEPVPSSKTGIIGSCEPMQLLFRKIAKVAPTDATVLIQGESGTGKELVARAIHSQSTRANKPIVCVNCAAIPETLIESELFGYEKGAFTGAIQDHRGKFEQAHTGTILLDEISEMALPLQAKLLRVLQEYQIDKVGGKEPIPVDVRVIATTNQNLMEMVDAGKFREDLFFRLNVIPLSLPPLRDRMDDVPLLVSYFIKKHSKINNRNCPAVSRETLNILTNYHWRGNVRELENVMERALLLCNGEEIQPNHLLMSSQLGHASINEDLAKITTQSSQTKPAGTDAESKTFSETQNSTESEGLGIEVGMSMKEAEKRFIFKTLHETKGNRTHAAKTLGISIRTLRNKLNEYRAEGEDFELDPED